MPSVLIADDHAMFREGLKLLLGADKRFQIIGEAETGEQALELIARCEPALAILDVALPDLNGIDVVRNVVKRDLPTKCIMLTMHEEPEIALSALNAGARGYILKGHTFDELMAAAAAVLEGRKFVSPRMAESVLDAATRQKGFARLTGREQEILGLISQGLANTKIAEQLRISEKTVHTHKARIMEKLDIHNTAELVRYALLRGKR